MNTSLFSKKTNSQEKSCLTEKSAILLEKIYEDSIALQKSFSVFFKKINFSPNEINLFSYSPILDKHYPYKNQLSEKQPLSFIIQYIYSYFNELDTLPQKNLFRTFISYLEHLRFILNSFTLKQVLSAAINTRHDTLIAYFLEYYLHKIDSENLEFAFKKLIESNQFEILKVYVHHLKIHSKLAASLQEFIIQSLDDPAKHQIILEILKNKNWVKEWNYPLIFELAFTRADRITKFLVQNRLIYLNELNLKGILEKVEKNKSLFNRCVFDQLQMENFCFAKDSLDTILFLAFENNLADFGFRLLKHPMFLCANLKIETVALGTKLGHEELTLLLMLKWQNTKKNSFLNPYLLSASLAPSLTIFISILASSFV